MGDSKKARFRDKFKIYGEQLSKIPKRLYPFLTGFALLGAAFTAFQLALFFTVNSDFFAAEPEYKSSPANEWSQPSNVKVVIRLVSLNEAANTIQIAVGATVIGDLKDEIRSGKRSIVVKVGFGMDEWGFGNVAIVKIDKDTPIRRSFNDPLESDFVSGSVLTFRDVSPYPYDSYETQMDVTVTDSSGYHYDLPFTTQVVKLFAGRHMEVDLKSSNLANIKLVRPRMQQLFVVCAAGVYVLIIIGISVLLFVSPGKQTPQELIFACAGLLLGSVGFRDLIGLKKLSSFGAGDVLIIGIPLLCLTGALMKTALGVLSTQRVSNH